MPNLEIADCSFNAKGSCYFDCVVKDYYNRPNKDGTNWSLNFMLEISTGSHAGKHIYADNWLSPNAIKWAKERLEKCFGLEIDDPDDGNELFFKKLRSAIENQTWMGLPVCAQMKVETYNGKDSLKVNGLYPIGNRKTEATDDDWAALSNWHKTGDAPTPKTAGEKAASSTNDDDLPF